MIDEALSPAVCDAAFWLGYTMARAGHRLESPNIEDEQVDDAITISKASGEYYGDMMEYIWQGVTAWQAESDA